MADDVGTLIDTMRRDAQELEGCPRATQDVELNMRNRGRAIEDAMYGPANPVLTNDDYWEAYAAEFNTTADQARTMRCANCSFFDRSERILRCIEGGLDAQADPELAIEAGELGYCKVWYFKCASQRTCLSWAGEVA